MEQLIVITIFAICAAACAKILVVSYITANESRDINKGMLVLQSAAECYKAAAGDVYEAAAILGGGVSDGADTLTVYYDQDWHAGKEEDAAYVMRLTVRRPDEGITTLVFGDISVGKIDGGEIMALTTAARCENDG